jgi:hypothetical protein
MVMSCRKPEPKKNDHDHCKSRKKKWHHKHDPCHGKKKPGGHGPAPVPGGHGPRPGNGHGGHGGHGGQ